MKLTIFTDSSEFVLSWGGTYFIASDSPRMLQSMRFASGDTITNQKQIKYMDLSVHEPEKRQFPTHFFALIITLF
jgi:hypothetical protein